MLTRASLGDTLVTWRLSELAEQQAHHEQAVRTLPLLAQRLEHKANVRVTSVCSLEGVIVDTNRVLVRVGDYLLERTAHQAAVLAKEKAGVCTMLSQLLSKGADPNENATTNKTYQTTKDKKSSKTASQQKKKKRKQSSSEEEESSSEDYSDEEEEEEEVVPKKTNKPAVPKNLTSIPEADEIEIEKPFTIEEELTEADIKKAQMKLQ